MKEAGKALATQAPSRFFMTLRQCGALATVFPEIDALFGVPQPPKHHPEIDTGIHTMMVVDQAARLTDDVDVRLAALTHDLGKAATPASEWPRHNGHEARGALLVRQLGRRMKFSCRQASLCTAVAEYHTHFHRVKELRGATLLRVFEALDGFRKPENIQKFALACEADARGRTGYENRVLEQPKVFIEAFSVASDIKPNALWPELTGGAIGVRLRQARSEAIGSFLRANRE